MKVEKHKKRISFFCRDEDDQFSIYYDTRGDPHSDGITFDLHSGYDTYAAVFIDRREALELAKLITKLFGK